MNLSITGSNNDLDVLAKAIGVPVQDDTVTIPPGLGSGNVKRFDFSLSMQMIVVQFVFHEEIVFRRLSKAKEETITLGFRNVILNKYEEKSSINRSPSVYVSRTEREIEFHYPAGSQINLIIIIIKVSFLKQMLYASESIIGQLQPIFSNDEPFHFEESMSAEIQGIAIQLQIVEKADPLWLFHCRLKAENMIYLFFLALLKRKKILNYPLNDEDVKTIYRIKDRLLEDISKNPHLPELASYACMSESKMKKLFRQIFGKSIYNYYQYFRIVEAANMIREKKFTVSQAGYHVGFTSLSHFTTVFEQQMGVKPKKYSKEI